MLIPYRDDNPSHHFPMVTISLIAINIVTFVFLAFDPYYMHTVYEHGFIPNAFRPLTYFTSQFLHADILHLIYNMWFLWLFGDNLEDKLGQSVYLAFYLLAGAFSLLLHSFFASGIAKDIPTIGASGAISAVMGGYIVLFPRAKIRMLFFMFAVVHFRVSAYIFLGFWFIQQLFFGGINLSAVQTGEVAYWAHIGGFIFGAAVAFVLKEMFLSE